jgi:hypothetical protein
MDYKGFSAWRVDFKYNEELTQTFMSSNQIVSKLLANTSSPLSVSLVLLEIP